MCINGDPAPEKCHKGEYCEVGKTPQPCPMYTYNPFFQQVTPPLINIYPLLIYTPPLDIHPPLIYTLS